MSKIIFIFLALCSVSYISSSSALYHHTSGFAPLTTSYDAHDIHSEVVHVDDHDELELFSAIANGVFEIFAKVTRGKVEVLLWIKKVIFNLLISGLSHLRHLMIHNSDYVNGMIHTSAELLKILLTNQPHYAVPQVAKILNTAEQEYIPHY